MDTAGGGTERIGTGGSINGYDVLVLGDAVEVSRGGASVTRQTVEGLGRFLHAARDLRLGWAELPDFEVIYLYDSGDGGFGYAVNVDAPDLSEWGYAPFVA